jgi:hypothetical protein
MVIHTNTSLDGGPQYAAHWGVNKMNRELRNTYWKSLARITLNTQAVLAWFWEELTCKVNIYERFQIMPYLGAEISSSGTDPYRHFLAINCYIYYSFIAASVAEKYT